MGTKILTSDLYKSTKLINKTTFDTNLQKRLIFSMKNLQSSSSLLLQVISDKFFILLIIIVASCPLLINLIFPEINFLFCSCLVFVISMLLIVEFFDINTHIHENVLNLDEILEVYLNYYAYTSISLLDMFKIIGLYIEHDPQIEEMYLLYYASLIFICYITNFIIFRVHMSYGAKIIYDMSIKRTIKHLLVIIIPLVLGIFFILKTTFKTNFVNSDNKYLQFSEIISMEEVNGGFIKSTLHSMIDYEILLSGIPIFTNQRKFNEILKNKKLNTGTTQEDYDESKQGVFIVLKYFLSMIPMSYFIKSFDINNERLIVFILLFCCIDIRSFVNKKNMTYNFVYILLRLIIILIMLLWITKYDELEYFISLISSIFICFVVYNLRKKKHKVISFIKYINQQITELGSKSIEFVNSKFNDIGKFKSVKFDLKEGVKVGERVLINPCSIEIDMKNSTFRIERNGEYLVPNNICKNELDRILLDKFAKGEIDWSKQFEGMELDGYDIQTVQECGERIRRILTCSSIVLRGESGCGKTTLLKILCGLDPSYKEYTRVYGSNGWVDYNKCDAHQYHLVFSLLPESPASLCVLPVSLKIISDRLNIEESILKQLLSYVELDNKLESIFDPLAKLFTTLSSGEAVRLAAVHHLMILMNNNSSKVICLDKLNNSIDLINTKKLMKLYFNISGLKIFAAYDLFGMEEESYISYSINDGKFEVQYHSGQDINKNEALLGLLSEFKSI